MPFKKAKYYHHRRVNPREIDPKTYSTVPLSHTNYKGKKFKNIPGALARIGRRKDTRKIVIQVILIPKK